MGADEARSEFLDSLPPIEEGDAPDQDDVEEIVSDEPHTLPARERDENGRFVAKAVEAPIADAVTETEETPAVEEESEEAEEAETAPDETTLQAQYFADLKTRLEKLPEAEQYRFLAALGYIEPEAAEAAIADAEYEPVGAIEEKLYPVLNDVLAMPESFRNLTTELNEVLGAQSAAMDAAVVQNAVNMEMLKHFAELYQLEYPAPDVKAIIEGMRSGKSMDELVAASMKDAFAKNKARMEQARKERPAAVETANELEGIPRDADMKDILNHIRGRAMAL